jgi:hypothetical protein
MENILLQQEFNQKVNERVKQLEDNGNRYNDCIGLNLYISIEDCFGVASVVTRYYGINIKGTTDEAMLKKFLELSYDVYRELVEHSNLYTAENDYDEDDEDDN